MYDYIIVGAGSAGSVLAARLSEDPDVSVLLLEAGPPDTADNIHIPATFGKLFKTQVDWDYSTTAEAGCDGRRIYLPRGKTLGGSSSMNAMIYIRGNRADYDEWVGLGNSGWGYDDLLPYFLRAEDNERGQSELHGSGGPLAVSEGRSNNPMMKAFIEASEQAGLTFNEDFNGPEQEGVGYYQLTQRGGRRCSASAAYLHPALDRPNLTVEPRMLCHRILFEKDRAVGIEAERLGELSEFRAQREVIVCAGTYNSPQLLMLSGVGPSEHLQLREIPVVNPLPGVGQNLQDHPSAGLAWTTDEPVSLIVAQTEQAQLDFAQNGRGPLTSNVAEAGGFVRTNPGLSAPDIQFHVAPVMFIDEGLIDPPDHGIVVAPCVIKPQSRGTVALASADPTAKPVISHNYFSAEADMDTMVAGMRLAQEVGLKPALRRYCQTPYYAPASETDDDMKALIRRHVQTLYHPVGTCAMGSDENSVVDTELRVRGIAGLRVVDASVMPTIVRGNTNAATIAIAERASDLIRDRAPAGMEASNAELAADS
jgi:choline dehydrogenase